MTNSTTSPPTTTAPNISIPGVLVSIQGIGVLLRGPSNCGKSELALSLIHRGHQLVADDVVECSIEEASLIGRAPEMLADLIEIRDLGILNAREIFGKKALAQAQKIDIIIELNEQPNLSTQDRLEPSITTEMLLNYPIPCYHLHHTHTRPCEILVETLVKTWIIAQSGTDGSAQLKARLSQTLEAN